MHPLQIELAHPGLVQGNGRALRADTVLANRTRRVDRHLVVGLIAVFDA
jgi:hypothetical protein